MNAVLPFDGFLDVLRTKGYAVGLRERFALASLLERWEGTSTGEFRDGLAALVGRSEAEVQGIRHLFDDFYKDHLEAPAPPAPPEPSPLEGGPSVQPERQTFPYRRAWIGAALAVLVIVIALMFAVRRINQPTASTQPPAPPVAGAPSAAPPPQPDPAIAAPAPPPLPEPPSIFDWRVGAGTSGVVFVVSMSVLWILKSREARRRWLRQMWSARLAALPGPHHFTLMVRDRAPGLARADVEDAATLLGRAYATEAPARELDVHRSLRLTLRHGLFPHIVFKRRRVTDAILVFQDVCQDMEVWQPKVDRFLTDVARQGVALERYYFDGDIRRITHRPHRAPVPFDVVLGRRPDAAVLIISTGTALAPVFDQADDRWLIGLRNRRRRSWLSPLIDVRLWPTELGTLPVPVWPMTRLGLAQAAKDLAGIDGAVPSSLEQRIVSEGVVTQDGIERIKRLASLVPYPTMELLDALRVRFAPDVSDAVILHLIAETGSQPAPVLRLSDKELRRCLDAVRSETPRLEAAARQAIVETLRNSEPPAGSAAHLRWQAALSLQELVLADLRGADTTRALATLQELGQGPTWEEIRRAPRLVPSTPTLAEKLNAALGSDVGASDGGMPPSRFDSAAGRAPSWPWLWPGAREVVPAALLASFVFIGVQQLHLFEQTVPHVKDAYRLTYVPAGQGAGGQLLVHLADQDNATLPQRVDLYQEDWVFRSGIDVSRGIKVPGSVQLASTETGQHYQVRVHLPRGNLALSNAVWVPSISLKTVLIDAWPWARVTVKGATEGIRDQPTPFFVALAPGSYRLHFENANLKLSMDQDITVTSSSNVFQYPMHGFDAKAAAAALFGTPPLTPPPPPTVSLPPSGGAPGAESTPTTPDKPAAPPITAEQHAMNAIERLVKNYCAALETLKADRVKEWFPLAPEADLRGQFSQYKSLKCTPTLPLKYELLVAGPAGAARVAFEMKKVIQWKRKGGVPETQETIVTINVSRKDGSSDWQIDFVRHEPKPKT